MKGIVFNLLEDVVCREHGDETWDRLLEAVADEGVYTSLGSYPDERLFALVRAAAVARGQSEDEVLRWFGRQSMPLLAERYPMFFAGLTATRPFLLTLNDIIHPEVRKLYPGAYAPTFEFDTSSPDRLSMAYRSERRLCALAHGFIEGAADFFNEDAACEQPVCMHRGDPKCLFELRFRPRAA